MGKFWDTSSIDAMEKTAKDQADGYCSTRINGHWLSVEWENNKFVYVWGLNVVTRADAADVLKMKK